MDCKCERGRKLLCIYLLYRLICISILFTISYLCKNRNRCNMFKYIIFFMLLLLGITYYYLCFREQKLLFKNHAVSEECNKGRSKKIYSTIYEFTNSMYHLYFYLFFICIVYILSRNKNRR